jgi:amino acid transporter
MFVCLSLGYLILCFIVGYFGRNRSMTFWGYFFASIVLTPLVGLLLVIISKKKEENG